MTLDSFYKDQSAGLALQIKSLRGRARGFIMGEIVSFLSAVTCVVLVTLTAMPMLRTAELVAAAACMVVYAIVRQRDTRNDERIRRLEDLKQVYDNELSARRGDFGCYDDGQRYVDPHHAYTYDLDIFGSDGLYQRLCRMVTTEGCDAMAERLSSLDGRGVTIDGREPDGPALKAYHECIEALARNEKLRSEFISYGVRERIDTLAIRQALLAAGEVKVPGWFASPAVLLLAGADIVAFLVCIVLAGMGKVSGMLPLWWGVLQFFAVYLACMGPLREVSKAINRLHGQLRQMVSVVRLLDNGKAEVFRRLTGLLDGLDKRGNILGLFLVDTFALYDFFLVRKFLRWRAEDWREMEHWIDRVVQTDQNVSVATFLYNHPDTVWAELIEGDDEGTRPDGVASGSEGVVYKARGLYHPFLGERAVRNDFTVSDRHFYIITGANMAGKSTFLRSVGVNYVLARIGLPVFAESLRVSRFKLFSSMRTSDDLAHGISYFNAELLRLRQLLHSLSADKPSLIILDEILKGTNSLDKLNGSRLFLESVARMNVTGIVATHDLELSKMDGERYHNYCFEIQLGTSVTYSYKISPGVARNQNATFLLNQLLRDEQM